MNGHRVIEQPEKCEQEKDLIKTKLEDLSILGGERGTIAVCECFVTRTEQGHNTHRGCYVCMYVLSTAS